MSEVAAIEEKKSVITKLDLLKAWFKWCLAVEVPVSFDRMQALAFGYSMNKILQKLYKDDPEELKAAMKRHHSMFNTNCDWGSIIHGITISLEPMLFQDTVNFLAPIIGFNFFYSFLNIHNVDLCVI